MLSVSHILTHINIIAVSLGGAITDSIVKIKCHRHMIGVLRQRPSLDSKTAESHSLLLCPITGN